MVNTLCRSGNLCEYVRRAASSCDLRENKHILFLFADTLPNVVQIKVVLLNKTKYMIMSREQNAGRSHSMKIDNSSIERVEEFKYRILEQR